MRRKVPSPFATRYPDQQMEGGKEQRSIGSAKNHHCYSNLNVLAYSHSAQDTHTHTHTHTAEEANKHGEESVRENFAMPTQRAAQP